jgi:hypothetical protein
VRAERLRNGASYPLQEFVAPLEFIEQCGDGIGAA